MLTSMEEVDRLKKNDLLADFSSISLIPEEGIKPVVVEPFFDPNFAEALATQFPKFDDLPKAFSGNGRDEGRSLRLESLEQAAAIGNKVAELYEFGTSDFFQHFAHRTTNEKIDPSMTAVSLVVHEPGHSGLLPHVDHRRSGLGFIRPMSIVVYLNEVNEGGLFHMGENEVSALSDPLFVHKPKFNSAIVFRRKVNSWHAVTPISEDSSPRLTVTFVPQRRELKAMASAIYRRGIREIRRK